MRLLAATTGEFQVSACEPERLRLTKNIGQDDVDEGEEESKEEKGERGERVSGGWEKSHSLETSASLGIRDEEQKRSCHLQRKFHTGAILGARVRSPCLLDAKDSLC